MNKSMPLERASDFFVKMVIVFTSFLSLLFFADYYGQFVLVFMAWLMLFALLIKGIVSVLIADKILRKQEQRKRVNGKQG